MKNNTENDAQNYNAPGLNARKVIEKRYSLKDKNGNPTETWPEIANRVVQAVAMAETEPEKYYQFCDDAYYMILNREFIPNTPCLVNAGKKNPQLAACYVLNVPDSIEGIMEHAKTTALVHMTGGGTGMSYEKIRPSGSLVNSTHGVASGPVSFMNIVNATTDVIKQGGVRRGANMGILRCDHPDILRFIHVKNDQTSLLNFNISVTVTDEFMHAVENKSWYQTKFDGKDWPQDIYDPLTGENYYREGGMPKTSGMLYAPDVWNRIIQSAHKYAEPGVIFIDEVNRHNYLMDSMGAIIATNPCQPGFALVYTKNGVTTFDGIEIGSEIWSETGWTRVLNKWSTGIKKVSQYVTERGSFIGTENHRVVSGGKKIEVKDAKTLETLSLLKKDEGKIVKEDYPITETKYLGEFEVFDITVDNYTNTYCTGGVNVSNCAEQALHANNSCNLGSIDVSKFYIDDHENLYARIAWFDLEEVVKNSVRFLDNVIDVCKWPTPEIDDTVKRTRPIGLGVMGVADLLIKCKLRYDSQEGRDFVNSLMSFIRDRAWGASNSLAEEKGSFPELYSNADNYRNLFKSLGFVEPFNLDVRNYETTTVAPTGCQAPNTLVVSNKGILRLDELGAVAGEKWQDLNSVNVSQEKDEKVATKFYVNGRQKTKKITLYSGTVLESTFNHQFRAFTDKGYEWVGSSHLNVGDRLATRIGGYNNTQEPLLKLLPERGNLGRPEAKLIFPTHMTKELAEFIGIYTGDGSLHENGLRIHFAHTATEDINYFRNLSEFIFGLKGTVEVGRTCTSVCLNSSQLIRWSKVNGLLKKSSITARIPKIIRESSKESILAFLSGLHFADGSHTNTTKYIDTSSFELAQELLVCMRAVGQNARIATATNTKGRISSKAHYRVYFVGFGSKNFTNIRYINKDVKDLALIAREIGEEIFYDTIIKIEDSESETFDIEVPENNTYLANNVVSHNTISLVAECSSGIEPNFSWAYIRRDSLGERVYVHPLAAEALGLTVDFYSEDSIKENAEYVMANKHKLPDYFVSAMDIPAEEHVRMLAVAQKNVDNSVSKTCNGGADDTTEDVDKLYRLARDLGCKCVAYYRDGSRDNQVLTNMQMEGCKDGSCSI